MTEARTIRSNGFTGLLNGGGPTGVALTRNATSWGHRTFGREAERNDYSPVLCALGSGAQLFMAGPCR